jgi:hypothetical protein
MIRRFIAEHAWRMVFAKEPISDMQLLRSRRVDREEFQREREQWAEWHQQQTAAEREMEFNNADQEIKKEDNLS